MSGRFRELLRSRSRRGVVVWVLLTQTLIVAAGAALVFWMARRETAESLSEEILAVNARVADWVGQELALLGDSPTSGPGSPQWDRWQSRVESLSLAGGGFVCVLDEDGRVLCHPEARGDPSLLGMQLGTQWVVGATGESSTIADAGERDVAGRATFSIGDTHYLVARELGQTGLTLLVHQPESGLASAATPRFAALAGGIGVVTMALTGLLSRRIIGGYESHLERVNKELEREVERQVRRGVSTRDAMLFGLAKLADFRDTDTGSHLDRIREYATLIAREARSDFPEVDDAWIELLGLASSMHDIGKVGVPDAVLLKPGALTDEERRRMQSHAAKGADTLIAIRERFGDDPLLNMSIAITLEHHERWDGRGYPLGLAAEQISLSARIVAIADAYDALTSARVYKAAMPHERAVAIILGDAGTHFDPAITRAFQRVAPRLDEARLRTNAHERDAA